MTNLDNETCELVDGGGLFGTICGLLEDWLITPCPYR